MFILYVEDCHCACTWDESALKALLGVKWAPDAIYIILFFQLHFALYFMGFRLNIWLFLYISIYFFFSPDALHNYIFSTLLCTIFYEIKWALDLIYDYFYIFIFTFTPDAMYHSILSTLLCKYVAKKRDTLHAHISKHEHITFNCHICNLKSKKNGALHNVHFG